MQVHLLSLLSLPSALGRSLMNLMPELHSSQSGAGNVGIGLEYRRYIANVTLYTTRAQNAVRTLRIEKSSISRMTTMIVQTWKRICNEATVNTEIPTLGYDMHLS